MSRRLKGSRPQWVSIAVFGLIGLSLVWSRTDLFRAAPASSTAAAGEAAILGFFEDGTSGDMVMVEGSIDRLLSDDNDGSRHQRFVLQLPSGHTLLVAHNIDLAPRVPVGVGDVVVVNGQYEWNDQGGLLHWTHHDPAGERVGGWIEAGGERYR